MFIDQEEKLHPLKKWGLRFLKIGVFFGVLLAVFVTILANMGGSSPTLKESAQKFIGDSFGGRPAVVQNLVRLSFFPLVGMDVEKVQVTNPQTPGSSKPGDVVALFTKIKFYMDFWDVIFRNPRFRTLLLEDGFIGKGIVGDKSMILERAYVDHDESSKRARILANGTYDELEWTYSMGLDILGALGKYEYEIGERTPIALDITDLHISADVVKTSDSFMKLEGFKFERGGQSLSGDLYASLISANVIKLRGDLAIHKDNTRLIKLDLIVNFQEPILRISGDVTGSGFAMDDVFGENSLRSMLDRAFNIFRDLPQDQKASEALAWNLSVVNYDLKFDLKHISLNKDQKATWTMRVKQNAGDLQIENAKGTINDKDFDVPVVAVLQVDQKDKSSLQLYALASTIEFPVSGFHFFQKNAMKDVDANGIKGCAMTKLFTDESDMVDGVETNPSAQKIKIPATDYVYLASVFSGTDQKKCLDFFEKMDISIQTPQNQTNP